MNTESPGKWTRTRGFVLFFAFLLGLTAVLVWFNTSPPNLWGTATAAVLSVFLLGCAFCASDEACEIITFSLFT
jgi:hypothetical protein